jgi:hypothetical protein
MSRCQRGEELYSIKRQSDEMHAAVRTSLTLPATHL